MRRNLTQDGRLRIDPFLGAFKQDIDLRLCSTCARLQNFTEETLHLFEILSCDGHRMGALGQWTQPGGGAGNDTQSPKCSGD